MSESLGIGAPRPKLHPFDFFAKFKELKDYVDTWRRRTPIVDSGLVSFTPIANTPVSVNVTFNVPFENVPTVMATMNTGVPGTIALGVGVTSPTTTGFVLWFTRTNTTATNVFWLAVDNRSS